MGFVQKPLMPAVILAEIESLMRWPRRGSAQYLGGPTGTQRRRCRSVGTSLGHRSTFALTDGVPVDRGRVLAFLTCPFWPGLGLAKGVPGILLWRPEAKPLNGAATRADPPVQSAMRQYVSCFRDAGGVPLPGGAGRGVRAVAIDGSRYAGPSMRPNAAQGWLQ